MYEMQFIALCLFFLPFAIAIVMPTWRALFGYVVLACVVLGAQYVSVVSSKTNTGLEAIGFLYVIPAAISVAIGALARTASLAVLAHSGPRAYARVANGAGFIVLVSILAAGFLWAHVR